MTIAPDRVLRSSRMGRGRAARRLRAGVLASPKATRSSSASSPTSRGRPTTGTTAACDRGSSSTPICRRALTSSFGTLAHEAFPGHHLEHAWKEQRLVTEQGRVEASIQLINTPEAYISEGLAEVGPKLLVDRERWQSSCWSRICERAGIADDRRRRRPVSGEISQAHSTAARQWRRRGVDAARRGPVTRRT